MPKVRVHLPRELYRQAKEQDLPLSTLLQRAVSEALDRRPNEEWLAVVRSRPPRVERPVDTARLLDEGRDEFGA